MNWFLFAIIVLPLLIFMWICAILSKNIIILFAAFGVTCLLAAKVSLLIEAEFKQRK